MLLYLYNLKDRKFVTVNNYFTECNTSRRYTLIFEKYRIVSKFDAVVMVRRFLGVKVGHIG